VGESGGYNKSNTCEQREMSYSRTERNYSNQYEQLGGKRTCASIYIPLYLNTHTPTHVDLDIHICMYGSLFDITKQVSKAHCMGNAH